jgi:hypothetical protein
MCQLWPSADANEPLLRELFLQRLPSNVRMVLAPSGVTVGLNDLAEMADRVLEVSVPAVSAVRSPIPHPPIMELESLRSEVRQLQEMMRSLSTTSRLPRHRSPTPARRRSPSPSRPSLVGDSSLCWYHQRFGATATKCRPPCRLGKDQASR